MHYPPDLPLAFGRLADMVDFRQSALTDFLASHNISARQIRDEAEQRRQQAATRVLENDQQEDSVTVAESSTIRTRSARRKLVQGRNAPGTAKKAQASKKRKKHLVDSDDDDELARAFDAKHGPLPGQMENCIICRKRFTVTPYTLAGPDGGLLCASCGKELAKEREGLPKKKRTCKQVGGVGSRRTMQSRILDGDVGTKSLAALCVHTLAKNVDMAESLGDLPEHLIDKIARLFSKRRLLKPETLALFVQPNTEILHIYDGAKLSEQDFIRIFQVASGLRRFKVRCAIQFKDEVMDYLLSRDVALESFYLHGANLLSKKKWHEFLAQKGRSLGGLQVYYTDKHFGDNSIAAVVEHCPSLSRLKVEHNQTLTDQGMRAMGQLSSLEHLGLQLHNRLSPEAICETVSKLGQRLRTLSLKVVPEADNSVLRAIHQDCLNLHKLRITDSEKMTDQGFSELFTGWKNPPLQFIDLQKCRHIDSTKPRSNDEQVGLCNAGFKALMAHSGSKLERLNVHACRHITREAFEEVFGPEAHYPELKHLEISFCEEVTDFVLGCIFRACPRIKEVNVFGCMKVCDVRVPRGMILVGVPNARGMVMEGTD